MSHRDYYGPPANTATHMSMIRHLHRVGSVSHSRSLSLCNVCRSANIYSINGGIERNVTVRAPLRSLPADCHCTGSSRHTLLSGKSPLAPQRPAALINTLQTACVQTAARGSVSNFCTPNFISSVDHCINQTCSTAYPYKGEYFGVAFTLQEQCGARDQTTKSVLVRQSCENFPTFGAVIPEWSDAAEVCKRPQGV